ncbi:MAG TPA: glutathione peroxidase [Kofleriaceae bacterium]|nr:glutathione peroxidase [Kofleriaceae bacterium]
MRDSHRGKTVRRATLAAMIAVLAAACGASQDEAATEGTTPAAGAPAASPAAATPAAEAPATAPPTATAATAAAADQSAAQAAPAAGDKVTSLYQFTARTIEGKDQPLSTYQGKVALVVNTASQCGFTPQYTALEAVWKKYKDKGLVVLGFPSNDFGQQEPGTDKEVLSFCQMRYGVTFPLFSKSVVKGSGASPIFRFLASGHGEPQWNFHKYLVDKKGVVVAAFPSKVTPDDPALTAAIDKALAAP